MHTNDDDSSTGGGAPGFNDQQGFTRPLGATPPNIQRMIDGANADLAEGKGAGIGSEPRDKPALTLMSESDTKKPKRKSSAVRRQKGESLHADARLRIYRLGDSNNVRVVLSGPRSGISVEATCNGNIMIVMVTLARLWLRGADMLAKDTAREAWDRETAIKRDLK